ncbi:MAG: hypothetical protein AAGC63_15105 [Propionicimonas sp.]|nr:hypothetical protein [Propionicimonas sp.]
MTRIDYSDALVADPPLAFTGGVAAIDVMSLAKAAKRSTPRCWS